MLLGPTLAIRLPGLNNPRGPRCRHDGRILPGDEISPDGRVLADEPVDPIPPIPKAIAGCGHFSPFTDCPLAGLSTFGATAFGAAVAVIFPAQGTNTSCNSAAVETGSSQAAYALRGRMTGMR